MLQGLGHERTARYRLMATLSTFYYCLHNTRKNSIDICGVARCVFLANLCYRFFIVRSVKIWSLYRSLLFLQSLEQVNHKLVAIMLQYWVKTSTQKSLKCRLNCPALITGRLTVYNIEKIMDSVAEIKYVTRTGRPRARHIVVILQDKVISQLMDRYQALQTCIHVAIECVVFQSNYAIFKVRQSLIFLNHWIWFLLLLLITPTTSIITVGRILRFFICIALLFSSHLNVLKFCVFPEVVQHKGWSAPIQR